MKKNLRSLLCGLLALVLVCSCAGAAFAKDNGATPVISVHGMGGSGLYLNPGTEDEQPVGVFDAKSLLSRGGLIQNDQFRILHKNTCNCHTFFLPET